MKKILFYSDSKIFGGHEKMFLKIIYSLVITGTYSITIAICTDNIILKKEVKKITESYNIKVILLDIYSNRLQSLRVWFQWIDIFKLIKIIRKNYNLVCICQGSIEFGAKMLLAGKISHIPMVSYIPNTSDYQRMNAKFSMLRGLIAKILYKFPDYFITISKFIQSYIECHTNCKIFILPNTIDLPKISTKKRPMTINRDVILTVVGILSKTKNQIFLVNWLSWLIINKNELFYKIQIKLFGSYDEKSEFVKIINDLGFSEKILLCGWTEDISSVLNETDILIIPSLCEGVPLIMLEAAIMRVPLLASDVDGMHDFLPHEMKYELNNFQDFTEKLNYLIHNLSSPPLKLILEENYSNALQHNSIDSFVANTQKIFNDILS